VKVGKPAPYGRAADDGQSTKSKKKAKKAQPQTQPQN